MFGAVIGCVTSCPCLGPGYLRSHGVFQSCGHLTFCPLSPRYKVQVHTIPYPAAVARECTLCQHPQELARWVVRKIGAPLTAATGATTISRVRNDSSPCSLVQVQAVLCKDHAAAPMLQSPARRAPQRPEKKQNKRDILRRTAIHASNRRVLLVPRESQFMAC